MPLPSLGCTARNWELLWLHQPSGQICKIELSYPGHHRRYAIDFSKLHNDDEILLMQSSKFWKLQKIWFKLKGLYIEILTRFNVKQSFEDNLKFVLEENIISINKPDIAHDRNTNLLFLASNSIQNQSIPLPSLLNPVSQLCTQNQFDEDIYKYWLKEIKENKCYHRKQWEFIYILQAVATNGLLTSGKKAIGFGVGKEPLPAVFAKNGVTVLGTDLNTEFARSSGWVNTNQHAANLDDLNNRDICDPKEFIKLVDFQFLDMNQIPIHLVDFDFCWSSCAFEHLGSLEAGIKFVENSLKCLKPGGLAVHTTEFNCLSDKHTIESGDTVLFRKRDILELETRLKKNGHNLYLNLNLGDQEIDRYIDIPPYTSNYHLKLQISEYTTTSLGIIIQKSKNSFQ